MENWIVTIISIIIICMTAAISLVIILNSMNQRNNLPKITYKKWHVELWNIRYGYKVDLCFNHSQAVGRYHLLPGPLTGQHVPEDNTISREHILLYEQNGILWIWNLSNVNPANINGYRLNEPQQLQLGTRIELGNSVFLLTNIQYC